MAGAGPAGAVDCPPAGERAASVAARPASRGEDAPGVSGPIPLRRAEGVAEEAALLRRLGRGDRAALAGLYDRHARAAYSLAARLVGPAAAEDVVHDAFLLLAERPGAYDPARGSFRGWFLTVVHHRCLNLLRAAGKQAGEEALAALPDPAPEAADALVRRLEDAAVRGALEGLPPEQRQVLALAYYGGLSQSALAAGLGVPLGTIKARMRRGLLALRGRLAGEAARGEEGP